MKVFTLLSFADIKKIREKLAKLESQPEGDEEEFSENIPVQDIEKQILTTKSKLAEIQFISVRISRSISGSSRRFPVY